MTAREKCIACLSGLNPAALDYDAWLRVGMAMRHSGCSLEEFDAWSRADTRYDAKAVAAKWKSFKGSAHAVTIASLIQITREHGNLPDEVFDRVAGDKPLGKPLGWDDVLPRKHAFEPEWVAPVAADEIPCPPPEIAMAGQLATYLRLMFQPDELVCYCIDAFERPEKPGKWLPTKGVHRTAGELIAKCEKHPTDIGAAIGDANADAGAWVRINPMDGQGVADSNVTAYRHALLEADEGELAEQLATIKALGVPVSCIVHSGGKSVHALVRVEARDYDEYRQRVDYLFRQAEAAGLNVDGANRNPSRYSRIPGVYRAGHAQYILAERGGAASWSEWVDSIEDAKDQLPPIVTLASSLGASLPDLPEEVVSGLLRRTEKLVLAGPSGAGKSFALDQLAVAIAEGAEWLGFKCSKGRPLYLNAELHAASCFRRFAAIYDHSGLDRKHAADIEIWNLRGEVRPLDQLISKLIRTVKGRGITCLILDPIYKFMVGDENNAGDMGRFVNLIDKIGNDLGVAVAYAHHHSKGAQGGKRAMDRASGSGVFARDADAMVDMVGLVLDDQRRKTLAASMRIRELEAFIGRIDPDGNRVPENERDPSSYVASAQRCYSKHRDGIHTVAELAHIRAQRMTGWRVEIGKVRDYARPPTRNVWFDFPLHVADPFDLLTDAKADGEDPAGFRGNRTDKARAIREKQEANRSALEGAIEECGGPGNATVKDVAETLGITERSAQRRLSSSLDFESAGGRIVSRKGKE